MCYPIHHKLSYITTVRMPLLTAKDGELFRSRLGDPADRTNFDFKAVYT